VTCFAGAKDFSPLHHPPKNTFRLSFNIKNVLENSPRLSFNIFFIPRNTFFLFPDIFFLPFYRKNILSRLRALPPAASAPQIFLLTRQISRVTLAYPAKIPAKGAYHARKNRPRKSSRAAER
jgi:hypothetical protein